MKIDTTTPEGALQDAFFKFADNIIDNGQHIYILLVAELQGLMEKPLCLDTFNTLSNAVVYGLLDWSDYAVKHGETPLVRVFPRVKRTLEAPRLPKSGG